MHDGRSIEASERKRRFCALFRNEYSASNIAQLG